MKKNIVVMVIGLLIAVPLSAHAFPTKKGDKPCTECHKLSKQEAETIVKKIAPNGTVTDIKVAPLKSVWQIEVDAGEGKHGTLYLDFSKKYLIAARSFRSNQSASSRRRARWTFPRSRSTTR